MPKNVGPISLKTQANSYPQYKPKENGNDVNNIPQVNTSLLTPNNNSLNNIKSGYYPSQKFAGNSQNQQQQFQNNPIIVNSLGSPIGNINGNLGMSNFNTMNNINMTMPNSSQWHNNTSAGLF